MSLFEHLIHNSRNYFSFIFFQHEEKEDIKTIFATNLLVDDKSHRLKKLKKINRQKTVVVAKWFKSSLKFK